MIKLGTQKESSTIVLTVPSEDCLIAEVVAAARRQLPEWLGVMLRHAERDGATVFLSMQSHDCERLVETRRLRDYQIENGCTLWMWCGNTFRAGR